MVATNFFLIGYHLKDLSGYQKKQFHALLQQNF